MRNVRGVRQGALAAGGALGVLLVVTAAGGTPLHGRQKQVRWPLADTTDTGATPSALSTASSPAVTSQDSAGSVSTAPLSTPDSSRQRVRPAWVTPDSTELAAYQPSAAAVTGIVLTAGQVSAMAAARGQYRPQLRALSARWQMALQSNNADQAAALQDSVRQVINAEGAAVLAVLTPAQLSSYQQAVQQSPPLQMTPQATP